MTKNETPEFKWDKFGNLVVDSVKANTQRIADIDKKWSDNFKWLLVALLSVISLISGAWFVDHREMKKELTSMRKELTQLKLDFGSTLLITRPDHQQALEYGYDTYIKRYFDNTSRGSEVIQKPNTNGNNN